MAKEEERRDSRHRNLKELEALQALSNSLTYENKGLRREKIAIQEKVEHLQAKVQSSAFPNHSFILKFQLTSNESDLEELTSRLTAFRRKYADSITRLRSEVQRQNET